MLDLPKKEQLVGTINKLKDKTKKSNEELLEYAVSETVKTRGKQILVAVVMIGLAFLGGEAIDPTKIGGFIITLGSLILCTFLYFFWKQTEGKLGDQTKIFENSMNHLEESLKGQFEASISEYNRTINNLILDVQKEQKRIHTYFSVKQYAKEKHNEQLKELEVIQNKVNDEWLSKQNV